ncbi:hypothetical protein EVA_04996 [gut metagenome]|uniref:Uncharacterized protein n=1 Tax=gut metagenome TaxID=749906 RepID=J9GHE1_9ZZZZ
MVRSINDFFLTRVRNSRLIISNVFDIGRKLEVRG